MVPFTSSKLLVNYSVYVFPPSSYWQARTTRLWLEVNWTIVVKLMWGGNFNRFKNFLKDLALVVLCIQGFQPYWGFSGKSQMYTKTCLERRPLAHSWNVPTANTKLRNKVSATSKKE